MTISLDQAPAWSLYRPNPGAPFGLTVASLSVLAHSVRLWVGFCVSSSLRWLVPQSCSAPGLGVEYNNVIPLSTTINTWHSHYLCFSIAMSISKCLVYPLHHIYISVVPFDCFLLLHAKSSLSLFNGRGKFCPLAPSLDLLPAIAAVATKPLLMASRSAANPLRRSPLPRES